MYKLVAIDLDGTLLNSHKHISERNKNALTLSIEKGIKIVICSGRIFAGARIFAREISVKEPVIACNGAVIKNMATDEVLFSDTLSIEDTCKIIEICRSRGIYFHIYVDDSMYTETLGFSSLFYSKMNQELPEKDRVDIRLVEDTAEVLVDKGLKASKIVVVSENLKQLADVRKMIEQLETVDVMSSNYDNFEVVNHGVNKGQALKFLSSRLGIAEEEIIAIGDNENDLTMLEFAGLGVAMGNAEAMVKEIADEITSRNDEDGVAKILEKYVL